MLLNKLSYIRPACGYLDYLKISTCWIVPSFIGTLILSWAAKYKSSDYLTLAIDQGTSPQLWNIVGAFGLALFGLSVATLKFERVSKYLSKLCSPVLIVSFEIGLLGLGVIFAKLFIAFDKAQLDVWQTWFYGVSFWVLILIVLALNSTLWLAARIVERGSVETPLLGKMKSLNWLCQVGIGAFFIVAPILYFWLDK